jgi:hypothetical protein
MTLYIIKSQVFADMSVYCVLFQNDKSETILKAIPFFSVLFRARITLKRRFLYPTNSSDMAAFSEYRFINPGKKPSYGAHCYKNPSQVGMLMTFFPEYA